ncbi:cytochrome P450 [Camillea tinctor]|nr:cytochrome P450 [Camillea tinctor]
MSFRISMRMRGGISTVLNKGFPKNNIISGAQGYVSIIDANNSDHTIYRKALKPCFSAKSIRKQEAAFRKHINILMQRLWENVQYRKDERNDINCVEGHSVVDIVKWLNFFTFDATGDFVYSESYGCLSEQAYHPWINLILNHLSASSLLIILRFYTPLDQFVNWAIDKCFPTLSAQKEMFMKEAFHKGERRMQNDNSQLFDVISLLQRQDPPLSKTQIQGNATLVSIAGSETTATVLASIFCYMNPGVIAKLTAEIRSIRQQHDLTLSNLEKLPFLTATILEGLRLGNPLPTGLPRVVPPEGAWICGQWVTGGTIVGVSQLAGYHSKNNFLRPEEFLPERLLANGPRKFSHDNRDIFRPFFTGSRSCLGQNVAWAQMRLALGHILWTFDMKSLSTFHWQDQRSYYLWHKEPWWVELSLPSTHNRPM